MNVVGHRVRHGLRPFALSKGALAPIVAWLVALAIVRLTGAAAVALLLVASIVGFIASAMAGWWRLRSVDVVAIATPGLVTAGDNIVITVDHNDRSGSHVPIWVDVLGTRDALDLGTPNAIEVTIREPGVYDHFELTVSTPGAPALVWWHRRFSIAIDPIYVAPRAAGPVLPVDKAPTPASGSSLRSAGPRAGEVDGARPWRPGENQQSIHWPSTMRSSEIIAHDHQTSAASQWTVPLNAAPERLRYTIEEGLRRGHEIALIGALDTAPHEGLDDSEPIPVRQPGDAVRWSALAAQRQNSGDAPLPRGLSVWKRQLSFGRSPEIVHRVGTLSRVLTSVAAIIAIWMLQGALQASSSARGLTFIGVTIAGAASLYYADGKRPLWTRIVVVALAIAALGRITVQSSGIGGLLEALRGPMPDFLILLVILHGAEIDDRRTNRVHIAITGIITAYAAGLRIDGAVGWWMLAWGIAAIAALCTTETRLPSHKNGRWESAPVGERPSRRAPRVAAWSAAGLVGTIALAAFVPVPDGPASLGLPALSNDNAIINQDGALVGPDGNPASPNSRSPSRGALGQAGGYTGFSNTLDTSVRGGLGEEIVMRVRAPEPAFWRGQTFADFDGRFWRVSEDVDPLTLKGPTIPVPPTIGDLPARGTPTEEFVQTYNAVADLPNVIFGAGRIETVIFDGNVTIRTDGALRADRTLTAGTVYSVVSQRVEVTAETLRAQRDLGERFAPFVNRSDIAPFVAIPDSTTQRTLDLANDLSVEESTYDTVLAYQNWLSQNTEYDLNSPVPRGDAVDDFLFESQRGFCEQIASSLVVMLRSQGVPARLATGYVPGTRDRISGVFEVQASDAHAWVEVWFPDTGWESFDPTAEVPLAGDADRSTVGAEAAGALLDGVLAHPLETAGALALGFGGLGTARLLIALRRRRSRGPWGLLHDRFMALAIAAVTAPQVALELSNVFGRESSASAAAHAVADELDRVAFDPTHLPAESDRRRVAALLSRVEREVKAAHDRGEPVGATGSATSSSM
ncbi:MAG: transglutaminase-like putative cysteine protease [Ilumatobacter sp.]|jgi:transglutaminase-like putative cysteine protease